MLKPSLSKAFHIGCVDVKASRRIVVYPGKEKFKLDAKTEAMYIDHLLSETITGEVS